MVAPEAVATVEDDPILEYLPEDSYYDDNQCIVVGPTDVDRQLGIIAYHERTMAEMEEIARSRKADIDTWLQRRKTVIESKVAWHSSGLRIYLSATGQKSVDLPNGTIRKRKAQPAFIWPEDRSDEYKVVCGKLAETEFVNKNININKAAIKKHFRETGEIVYGIEVLLDQPDKFSYTVAEHLRPLRDR